MSRVAGLSGELTRSFSTGNTPPILLATGVVASNAPAEGIVKVSGHVERIGAPGRFQRHRGQPPFTGPGKTVKIAITGPDSKGGAPPPRPATLTYQRADDASRIFDGRWQCGS
ncbi:hypothetical protein NOF55_17215 [Rhizobiaceae bacterium BDR2-2]|uniref:Uncharacterized protein n=1 Tax=Ectorhizobium quercum TaxID=2965071 RepID=A0AAE3N285_9HYPH|nr:hypothetical protein [Ectorhizobium quercum]MCX8998856.1 hypothetical protein [Ectorhizobium quercum]